jgi:hypothetical protein
VFCTLGKQSIICPCVDASAGGAGRADEQPRAGGDGQLRHRRTVHQLHECLLYCTGNTALNCLTVSCHYNLIKFKIILQNEIGLIKFL